MVLVARQIEDYAETLMKRCGNISSFASYRNIFPPEVWPGQELRLQEAHSFTLIRN